jgi:hypothetical protein
MSDKLLAKLEPVRRLEVFTVLGAGAIDRRSRRRGLSPKATRAAIGSVSPRRSRARVNNSFWTLSLIKPCATLKHTRPACTFSRRNSEMKSVVLFVTSTHPSLMARRTLDQSLHERSPSQVTCVAVAVRARW